jgi:hypothetical protein
MVHPHVTQERDLGEMDNPEIEVGNHFELVVACPLHPASHYQIGNELSDLESSSYLQAENVSPLRNEMANSLEKQGGLLISDFQKRPLAHSSEIEKLYLQD